MSSDSTRLFNRKNDKKSIRERLELARKRFISSSPKEAYQMVYKLVEEMQWNFRSEDREEVLPGALGLLTECCPNSDQRLLRDVTFCRLRDEFPKSDAAINVSWTGRKSEEWRKSPTEACVDVDDVDITLKEGEERGKEEEKENRDRVYLVSKSWNQYSLQSAAATDQVLSNYDLLLPVNLNEFLYELTESPENLYLKENIIQNIHFSVVSAHDFEQIQNKSGCAFPIHRPVKDGIAELYFPSFKVFGLYSSPRTVQISKHSTVKHLRSKLKQYNVDEFRLWTFSELAFSPDWLNSLNNRTVLTCFPGGSNLRCDAVSIESLQLGHFDTALFLETKKRDRFFLTSDPGDLTTLCHSCLNPALLIHSCSRCGQGLFCSDSCMQIGISEHQRVCIPVGACFSPLFFKGRRPMWERCNKGMKNVGASCYVNAAVQGLGGFARITMGELQVEAERVRRQIDQTMNAQVLIHLSDLYLSLRSPGSCAISAQRFKSAVARVCPQFKKKLLQDVHEFLLALIGALQEGGKERAVSYIGSENEEASDVMWWSFLASGNSVVSRNLYGQMEIRMECGACKHQSSTFQEFSILSLPINVKSETSPLKVWYFPLHAKSIIYEFIAQLSISVEELKHSLAELTHDTLQIGYMRGQELVLLTDQTCLKDYISAGIKLLAYHLPAKDPMNSGGSSDRNEMQKYCVVYQYVNAVDKTVNFPRVVVLTKDMTLMKVHRKVFKEVAPYYRKRPSFVPPGSSHCNGYSLFILHRSSTLCEFCQNQPFLTHCPLPYNQTLALVLGRQLGLSYGLQLALVWTKGQTKVDIKSIDCEEANRGINIGVDVSLEDCLTHFSSRDTLDLANQWTCPGCNQKTAASVQTILLRTPGYLIIHLKRFHITSSGFSQKVINHVRFPIDSLEIKPGKEGGKVYRLCAVVVHTGASVDCGHYYAICRQGEEWVKFDDARVERITVEDVKALEAYLLFYECVNTKDVSERLD